MANLPCNFVTISPTRVQCTTCGALFDSGSSARECRAKFSQTISKLKYFDDRVIPKSTDLRDR